MQPLVTILVPTYNRANLLRDALHSALAQTYSPLEVIVLDDASSDETSQVVKAFETDIRLRYIRHAANLGIVGNWKHGIEAAKGEFFCLLHDDDTFEPEFVETLVQPLIEDQSLILVFCDHWVMDDKGQRLAAESDVASSSFKRDLLPIGRLTNFADAAIVDMSIPVGATLFRTQKIPLEAINENAKGSIDAWLFYQCVKLGGEAFYVPQRLMNYRAHSGGMSWSMPIYMAEGHLFRYNAVLNDPALKTIHTEIRKKLHQAESDLAFELANKGDIIKARRLARKALRSGWNLRAFIALLLTWGGSGGRELLQRVRNRRHSTR